MIPDRHAEIAKRAYSLWELEGRPTEGPRSVPSRAARDSQGARTGVGAPNRCFLPAIAPRLAIVPRFRATRLRSAI
jgi:hypothetical protein